MLRVVVLLLLAANVALLGWTRGWLGDDWPAPRESEREPERLAAQVAPDAVRAVAPQEAAAVAAAASAASDAAAASAPSPTTACLETAPLDPPRWTEATEALAAAGFGSDRWERVPLATDATRSTLRIAAADADAQSRLAALPGLALSPCAPR